MEVDIICHYTSVRTGIPFSDLVILFNKVTVIKLRVGEYQSQKF